MNDEINISDDRSINFRKYFLRYDGHGNGLIVKGGVRKGKTTLLSMLAYRLKNDFEIVSNIRFDNEVYKENSNFHYVNTLSHFLKIYSEIPYTTPILLIWDDTQSKNSMTSKGANSKEGRKLASFLIFIGKLHTSFIYVAHQSYIPKSLIEGFLPFFCYKIEREDFYISTRFYEIDSDVKKEVTAIKGNIPFPKPYENMYPILSIAFTDFIFDVDLDELYKRLCRYDVGEKTKEEIAEYLNEHPELFLDNENTKTTLEYEKLKGLTWEQIYISICLKRNTLIPYEAKLNTIINSRIIRDGREKLTKMGIK